MLNCNNIKGCFVMQIITLAVCICILYFLSFNSVIEQTGILLVRQNKVSNQNSILNVLACISCFSMFY